MKKILLINEPFVEDFCRTQRWPARTRGRVMRAPDWLAYATAVLEKAGYDAKLYDFPVKKWGKSELTDLIIKEQPDFVVLDSTTPSIYSDLECAKIIKDNSNAITMMVGAHVSAKPEETLKISNKSVDIAVIGEYDLTIKDIVENYPNIVDIKGIAYIIEGKFIKTVERPLIEDLDALPFPSWHQLNILEYFDGGKLYPYITIISGRGCPNQCSFCLWPQVMHGRKYRFRSAKNVVDEIEHNISLYPKILSGGEFFFEDDTFTIDKERAKNVCEEILKRGLKIKFSANARVDTADLELFKLMKKAGLRQLLVGFESGSQNILNNVNKGITLAQSREFVKTAKKAGIAVHGCFIIGLPGETKESANETIKFANSLGLSTVQFSAAVPFPGTKYYNLCLKNNWIIAKDWNEWLDGGEQASVINHPGLSKLNIEDLVNKGLKSFYLRPSFMLKFLLTTKSKSDLYRKIRGGINFIKYLVK